MNKVINHSLNPINQTACHIKLKTTPDVLKVIVHYGDPHDYKKITQHYYEWNKFSRDMNLHQQSHYNRFYTCTIDNKNKRFKYYFELVFESGSIFYGQKGYFESDKQLDLYATFFFPYIHDHEIFKPTSWVQDQVWIQIFVDRFRNGDTTNDLPGTLAWETPITSNKHSYGGDLKGITQELDHLKSLGFTALYLTPIFTSPTNHKYDTIDYFEIDPQFGTKEDLKELVDECHKRDMKIILDAVFNHSGYFFKPFQDVVNNKENSDYKDWFHIISFEPLNYETFSTVPNMPKLNTHNPQVQDYCLKVLRHYLDEFKIDGWRFDVANELDHTFITKINSEIKTHYPDAYLLAEIWHDPIDFIGYNQFDGVMEYETGDVFIQYLKQEMDVDQLIQRLSDIGHRTPINTLLDQFHMLDSHDTQRLINMVNHDEDLALMALQFLMVQPGSVCLFYGTHYLLEGENDPFCRVPYPIEPNHKQSIIRDKIIQFVQFRKDKLNSINNLEHPYKLEKREQTLVVLFDEFELIFDPISKSVTYNHH